MNIKTLKDKAIRTIPLLFVLSIGMVGAALYLADNSDAFKRYVEQYPWILFIAVTPFLLHSIVFIIVFVFVLLQSAFEEYHNLREQGNSPEWSLFTIILLIIIIVGFIYLSLHFGGGGGMHFTE